MKNLSLIITSTLLAISLISCKKYEGDENRSSYTVNGRLKKGVWNLQKIELGGNPNNTIEVGDTSFACSIDFGITEGSNKLAMRWGNIYERDTVADFNLSNDKESIEFFDTDFKIYSMTWTDMIIESKESGNKYYLEKWISINLEDIPIVYDIGYYMPFW